MIINLIQNKISESRSYLVALIRLTKNIVELTNEQKIDELEKEMLNRERLISIIDQLQREIEKDLSKLEGPISEDFVFFVKDWAQDVTDSLDLIQEIDQSTLEKLEDMKDLTQNEISTVFRIKNNIKAYNLNSLK